MEDLEHIVIYVLEEWMCQKSLNTLVRDDKTSKNRTLGPARLLFPGDGKLLA